MLISKKVLKIFGIAIVAIILMVASFWVGYFDAIIDFKIDIFEKNIDKYVKLKEPLNITAPELNQSIELPKGALLYYEGYNVKLDIAHACLKIVDDSLLFEDRVEFIQDPGSYYMDISEEAREKYKREFLQ